MEINPVSPSMGPEYNPSGSQLHDLLSKIHDELQNGQHVIDDDWHMAIQMAGGDNTALGSLIKAAMLFANESQNNEAINTLNVALNNC